MKKLKIIFVALALSVVSIFADTPSINFYFDVSDPNPDKFDFSVRAGNTPVLTVYCQLTNGVAYTNFGTGWSAEFNYFQSDSASAGVTLSGTLTPATGVIVYNALTNTFPAQGKYFAEFYLHNGTTPKLTIAQGQLIVTRSPSSGSFGSLNLYNRINWDIISNQGTVPWAAGAEPVFYASAAYGITATQTSNWTTAYTHSQADTVTSNSGNWAGTWGGLTTNALSTTVSVALVTADVTELKGKTSGWDLAKSNGSAATNFIATNTLQTQITANLTNQNATNVLLLASITSLQNQVTANLTNQNATNTLLQSQIVGLATTNSFTAFQTNQIATNLLLLTQITTDRTNQVATNVLFQAFDTAQTSTNAQFQYLFGLQTDSNTLFQGLFETQANTNTALQTQITTDRTNQVATNANFESRIGSNETFMLTTQPATNAALLAQIVNYYTNQNSTNALLQAQITANLTNQNASNTVYLGWHTNQVNSNAIYSSYDARITSNSTWKVGTNDTRYTDTITNESLWIAKSNSVVYTNSALYLSFPISTNSLQVQVTANLTNQNATNALLRTAINNIDSSGWARALFVDGSKSINYLNVADTNYLGPNIVTNGTFTGGTTNWSLTTMYYQNNRVMLNPSLTGSLEYTNAMVIVTNTLYQLTLEIVYGNAAITATVGGVSYAWPSATETHIAYFNALTDGKIIIGASTGTNTLEIDNVTLKACPTGSVFVAGEVKAKKFTGDGSGLTGVVSTANATGLPWSVVSDTPTTYGAGGYGITNIPAVITDHTALTNINGSNNFLHLTLAEKAIATNTASSATSLYAADATSNVWVIASGAGIVATKTNEIYNFAVPSGIILHSIQLNNVDGGDTSSGVIRLALGTTCFPQGAIGTIWVPTGNAFIHDSPYNNVTLVCQPDSANLYRVKVSGLGTSAGTFYTCHFVW